MTGRKGKPTLSLLKIYIVGSILEPFVGYIVAGGRGGAEGRHNASHGNFRICSHNPRGSASNPKPPYTESLGSDMDLSNHQC